MKQIDEVSAKTLGSYVHRSAKDEKKRREEGAAWSKEMSKRTGLKLGSPIDRKLYGIHNRATARKLAIAKLTGAARVNASESVEQIDELSTKTLSNYIVKSAMSREKNRSAFNDTRSKRLKTKRHKEVNGVRSSHAKQSGYGVTSGQRSASMVPGYPEDIAPKMHSPQRWKNEYESDSVGDKHDFTNPRKAKRVVNKRMKAVSAGKKSLGNDPLGDWHGRNESVIDEVAFERDLKDHEPRVVSGVKGMKSKPFSKRFRNQAHQNKWIDSDDYGNHEVHYVERDRDRIRESVIDEVSQDLLKHYRSKNLKSQADAFNADDKGKMSKRLSGYAKATMRLKGVSVKTLHKLKNPMFDDK